MSVESSNNLVARMSVSLPEEQLAELDVVVKARGFASRSQAIGDMLHNWLVEHKREYGTDVMVGTVTLFYDNSVPGLQKRLADLQYENIAEVISSLHVHLANNQTLEVILVQGPAVKLQEIADELSTLRGVISGRMQLVAAIIPQLHPLPDVPLHINKRSKSPADRSNGAKQHAKRKFRRRRSG
ncbi:nickel-responsive transcriptional regulator NikR [Hyphomicrobium sp.]|uniref:nickel-responsive transcriptional regulator NikR n=1 Tax=Hyphomicrobium sp. TaxID=82 RepID=UPI003566369A